MELLSPFLLLFTQVLLLLFTFSFPQQAASRTLNSSTDLESLLAFKAQLGDPYGILDIMKAGNLKVLDVLDLSVNRLSGNISDALGQLVMLTHLNLSNNSFQGEIPNSLGALLNINYLNLSLNILSGSIPESIGNLPYLISLDLSFNKLEGQIPAGRVFSNLTIPSLEGNIALCGANIAHSNSRRKSQLLKYILPVVASIMVLLASLFLILAFHKWTVMNIAHTDHLLGLDDHRVVSYLELVRATDNFNQVNLIGNGSSGSVYRGCLDDGLIVAVKVLKLEVEGASKSFDAEFRALSTVRHRNLIKIITICSSPDFKALVLRFMSNGSLDQWLYSDARYLNLLRRLNVMVDVSSALEYLHHHHPCTVLHCDVKPSNVLLDEELVAHVGDFGIAKLLLGDSKSIASASTPGTIGYTPDL